MLNAEQKITQWSNDNFEKKLRNEGEPEDKIERIISKLHEIEEEQVYNALYFNDDLEAALKRGFTLEKEEIIKMATPYKNIKNPVKGKEFYNESGEINPESILLAHATNFPPQRENDNLFINSSGNVDPKHESLRLRKDEFKDAAGINNYRFTIHFGMVGGQPSHQEKLESGEVDQKALEKRLVLIILPLGSALEDGNTLLNLGSADTFFWDKVTLPKDTIIIVKSDVVSKLKLKKEDFAKYQIIVTDDLPADVYKNLMWNVFNKEQKKVANLMSKLDQKLKLKSGIISPDSGRLDAHYHSIFKRIELMPSSSLYIKEKKSNSSIDQKEYLKSIPYSLSKLTNWNLYTLKQLFKDNDNPQLNLNDEVRKTIISKIKPLVREDVEQLLEYCKPLAGMQLKNILNLERPEPSIKSEFEKFLESISESRNAIKELNPKIIETFPELNELLTLLDEVIKKNKSD